MTWYDTYEEIKTKYPDTVFEEYWLTKDDADKLRNHESVKKGWATIENNPDTSGFIISSDKCVINGFKMKEEFSKYDKVVYDGEVFEVLETADRTGMMKLCPLFKASYEYAWADEEMVVSLNRAIKLRIIDEETVDNLTDYSPIGEGLCNTNEWETTDAPFVGKDGSGKNDRVDGKLRWDLLPLAEIEDIVRVYTEGAKKYADNSWQDIPDGFNRYLGALMRHLVAYTKGERYDKEGFMHLAAVCWNAIALLYYDKHNKGLIEWKSQEKE